MQPKVSVIMTTYNAAKYIETSIQSLKKQTLSAWELVCIDGGSADDTLDIIRRGQAEDSRIQLYFQERPGIGAAKNCGIEKAKGEYLTFLDADDWYMDPDALERMYCACKEHSVSVCGAFRAAYDPETKEYHKEALHRGLLKGCPEGRLFLYRDCQYDFHFHSYLYDTQKIQQSDARFAETTAYDDTRFFIRAMSDAERFYVVPAELYSYRLHPFYAYGPERAMDVIRGMYAEMQFAHEHDLKYLYWLVVQRINYEYVDMFFGAVQKGYLPMIRLLAEINEGLDTAMLEYVQQNPPSNRDFTGAMIYRRWEDMPLVPGTPPYMPKYLLRPLGLALEQMQRSAGQQQETEDARRLLQDVYHSTSFRVGRAITAIPRKVRDLLKK